MRPMFLVGEPISASKRMDEILDTVGYGANGGVKLDGILSPADCLKRWHYSLL